MSPKNRIVLYILLGAIFILTPCFSKKKSDYVEFDENLLVSRYEVTNIQYREFLNQLKSKKNWEQYNRCRYDSAQWTEKFPYAFNVPMKNMYHWHPAYAHYPVVNISRDAAEQYCAWMTKEYNAKAKREYKKVVFRLPTEKEWLKVSSPLPGHNLPWKGNFPYSDSDGKTFHCNIKVKDYTTGKNNFIADGDFHTSRVGKYAANSLGVYDIIGNVAEITSDGKIKGGSWYSYLSECTIDKSQDHFLPDPRVGFRVVMQVIEN